MHLDSADAKEQQRESMNTCISLINMLVTGPIPIPIASSGSECGATLFFQDDHVYGDLEINGNLVEYYLKEKTDDGFREVFDSESVTDGFIPPRLLGHLFAIYAK